MVMIWTEKGPELVLAWRRKRQKLWKWPRCTCVGEDRVRDDSQVTGHSDRVSLSGRTPSEVLNSAWVFP